MAKQLKLQLLLCSLSLFLSLNLYADSLTFSYNKLDSDGNRLSTHAYTPYGSLISDGFSLQHF